MEFDSESGWIFSKSVSEFDARNRDLTWLTAEMLIDLDNYLDNRKYEDKSIKHLAYVLNDATQVKKLIKEELGYKTILDSTTINKNQTIEREGLINALSIPNKVVFAYAIYGRENFEKKVKGKEEGDLLVQINLAAKDLRDYKNLPKSRLEELGEFVLKLSRELAMYQEEWCPIKKYFAA